MKQSLFWAVIDGARRNWRIPAGALAYTAILYDAGVLTALGVLAVVVMHTSGMHRK